MTPETHIKNKFKTFIKQKYLQGKYKADQIWFRSLSDRYQSGLPDCILLHEGILFVYEVKRRGEQPTKRQMYELMQIKAAGGKAFVVTENEEGELAFIEL